MASRKSTPRVTIRTSPVATVTIPMRPLIEKATRAPSGAIAGSRTGSLAWVSRRARSFGSRRQ